MKRLVLFAALSLSVAGCASPPHHAMGGIHDNRTPRVAVTLVRCDEGLDMLPVQKVPGSVAIIYPFELRRAGITGTVLATATIEEDGRVSGVVVDHASQPEFGEPVMSGLKRCTFFPAKRGGAAVRCTAQCKVEFILDED